MTNERQRIYSLTAGDFQATVYPSGRSGYFIDIYHAGTDRLHSRFVCTGEEAAAVSKLATSALALIDGYLGQGRSYEQWCSDRGIDPSSPELP